jgi:YVTN family beta-propeller protein
MKQRILFDALQTAVFAAQLLLAPGAAAQGSAVPQYRITQTIPLGAPDRWDLLSVDVDAHRVYVAHGDRVTVVDGRSGARLGEVTGFPGGTHGVAIIPGLNRGYSDDGRAGEAAAFDLKTLQVGKRFKAQEDADAIVYDAVSGHVFVINGDSATVTVIDPKAETVLATVAAGGKLETGVSGGNGKVYVNGEAKAELVRLDVHSNQVDAHWPLPGCKSPHGLAIDTATHRLFVSCANQVLEVVDADSGAVIATLPIGAGTDAAAFDPKRRLVFSSNGRDGTLSIIKEQDASSFVDLGSIKTAPRARTMAIDTDNGRLFLVSASVDAAGKTAPGSVVLLFLDPAP